MILEVYLEIGVWYLALWFQDSLNPIEDIYIPKFFSSLTDIQKETITSRRSHPAMGVDQAEKIGEISLRQHRIKHVPLWHTCLV